MGETHITGIIPARYGSTRFPGKALADIRGKSMIQRVYEQAIKTLHRVVVATDDQRIADHVKNFGEVVMTGVHHQSGTDRCAEVIEKLAIHSGYIINIQGDEPFIQPEQIQALSLVLDGFTEIATLIKKAEDVDELENPNVVKVVINNRNEALYFSRHKIPFVRQNSGSQENSPVYYKHLGVYAYRTDVLSEIASLKSSMLEKAESLEQLRWLENGYKIKVVETNTETVGIDTPADLERLLMNPLFFGR
ncbi:MAG: 3-deoxy-manno-octulosonate cytidylyltransferase [Cyclobacteriaceae bacterium]|nr:3-deoxy-manno-octulosonate cytidylyltransferase [Cyclobacteriaceae bacterium]